MKRGTKGADVITVFFNDVITVLLLKVGFSASVDGPKHKPGHNEWVDMLLLCAQHTVYVCVCVCEQVLSEDTNKARKEMETWLIPQ